MESHDLTTLRPVKPIRFSSRLHYEESEQSTITTAPHMPARNRHLLVNTVLFLAIASGGLALDLWSKAWVFETLGMPGPGSEMILVEGVFHLQTSLNEGALFGIGQGAGTLFVTLSGLAVIGIILWLFRWGGISDRLMTLALACIMAGTLGNLYDRLGLPGLIWNYGNSLHEFGDPVYAVRDWLYFILIDWPIFNIADSLLVCGAGLLVLHAFLTPHPEEAKQATAS